MSNRKWERIQEQELPEGLHWDTMRQDQGQIIEVSYGQFSKVEPAGGGEPYRRSIDRSRGPQAIYYERRVCCKDSYCRGHERSRG